MIVDKTDVEDVAKVLGIMVDDGDAEAFARLAEELAASTTEFPKSDESTTIEDAQSDDPYGALLAVYDEPRQPLSDGPLDGLTVAVKDTLAVAGLTMTAGTRSFSAVPDFDAATVSRLRQAGSTVTGKANLEAFAFGITGEHSGIQPVENPQYGCVPGGSSSGCAAAVAGDLVDVGLGTDAGGSLRIPAACCGIVGAKPTHGTVPRHGLLDFAPSMDTVGPITQDVPSAARVLSVLAGRDLRDPSSVPHRIDPNPVLEDTTTIGLPSGFLRRSDDAVCEPVRESVATVADEAEIQVREVDFPLEAIEAAYLSVAATEFAWMLRQTGTVRGQGTGYTETIRSGVERAKERGIEAEHMSQRVLPAAALDAATDGELYAAARRESQDFRRRLADAFESVDVLVTPTLRRLPPAKGETTTTADTLAILGNTAPFNLAGNPAVAVPTAEVDGLPTSAQVVAPEFEDDRALAVASILEAE